MVDGNVGRAERGRTGLADEKGQRAGCTAESIVNVIASERLSGWRGRGTVNELSRPDRQVMSGEILEPSNDLSHILSISVRE
jgi:hypothetical protein